VREQVPFVLGWAITVHLSQRLTLTEAVLDLDSSFEAGMVHTAVSRVSDSCNVYVKTFNALRLFAAPNVMDMHLDTCVRAQDRSNGLVVSLLLACVDSYMRLSSFCAVNTSLYVPKQCDIRLPTHLAMAAAPLAGDSAINNNKKTTMLCAS